MFSLFPDNEVCFTRIEKIRWQDQSRCAECITTEQATSLLVQTLPQAFYACCKHLHQYVDEATFGLNKSNCKVDRFTTCKPLSIGLVINESLIRG